MRATTARSTRLQPSVSSSRPPLKTTTTINKGTAAVVKTKRKYTKHVVNNQESSDGLAVLPTKQRRPYGSKKAAAAAAAAAAEKLAASVTNEKQLVTSPPTTRKGTVVVPKVVKPTKVPLKVKTLKRLQKSTVESTATPVVENSTKTTYKTKKVLTKTTAPVVERQASPKRAKSPSPKRAKSQSPTRAAAKTPAAVTPPKKVGKPPKKNVTVVGPKKKQTPLKPKAPATLGVKPGRGRKPKSAATVTTMARDPPEVVVPSPPAVEPPPPPPTATKKQPGKKKRADSQDSSSPENVVETPAAVDVTSTTTTPQQQQQQQVKSTKKTKEKLLPKIKENNTKITTTKTAILSKKVTTAKKPKITQQEKSDYEKGVEEIDINESLIKLENVDNDKKLKSPVTKLHNYQLHQQQQQQQQQQVAPPLVAKNKKKVEIKKREEEEEEARRQKSLKEKKEKVTKVMVPPKKRAMAPLKKRLARAALDMDFKPPPPPALVVQSPAEAVLSAASPERSPKREEYSSSDDATLDVVLRRFLQQRQQQQQTATSKPGKKVAVNKSEPKYKKKPAHDTSSSAPSSPEPVTRKVKKVIKRVPKQAIAKKNAVKTFLPIKKRNLNAEKIRKKMKEKTEKKKKKRKKRFNSSGSDSDRGTRHSSSSEEERARRMKVFGFWSGPKKHRVASLNALAKVHCLYENEGRPAAGVFGALQHAAAAVTEGKSTSAVTTTTTTTTNISTRTLRSGPAGHRGEGRHWYDSASSTSSDSGSSSDTGGTAGALVPYRRRRDSSGGSQRTPNKGKKQTSSKPSEPPTSPPSSGGSTGRKVIRRKRCDMVMDLKDMVVRKRMASLNASAILAASYSFEKRTPTKSCTSSVQLRVVKVQQQTSTTSIQKHIVEVESDLDSTTTSPNQQISSPEQPLPRKTKPATVTSKRNSNAGLSNTGVGKKRRPSSEVKQPPKKRKRRATGDSDAPAPEHEDDEDDDPLAKVIKLRAPNKVAVIMNDTDVTITGVYVNTRSSEGYCISGMEYRISSTSHTQTEATTVLHHAQVAAAAAGTGAGPPPSAPPPQEHVSRHHHLHHHHHHHAPAQPSADLQGAYRGTAECDPGAFVKPQPAQNYTPLGALSSMQPPASLQQGVPGPIPNAAHQQPPMPQPPRVHHGGPSPLGRHGNSAFSAPPSAYGAPLQSPPDAVPYLPGYYQPAGPLIHAGSELCRTTSKLGGPAASGPAQPPSQQPSLLLPATSQEPHSDGHPGDPSGPSTSSPLPPPPPPSSHIVSSQGFRHYNPYPNYAPQYHPASHQYYHAPQSALVAASHHLAPPPGQDLCGYSPCYSPHYKYPHTNYRRFAPPPPHFYPPPSHQPDVYSLPGPSSAAASSSFQPPQVAPPSSAAPSSQQHQPEAGNASTSAPPPGPAYPPPPSALSQQPPEPPPTYQFYPGYSPGPAGACYPHAPPRGVAFLDASYQSCPCPMQSCPKNVLTGPLTGDSKGPGPQETLFVMPPVAAAAAAAHPTSASRGPLPPGHPPSPARGSSGGPPQAQGPSPPATADQSLTQQSPEAPAWVAAEPTPPPSDDSSAPTRGDTDLCDSIDSSTDVNQNYRGNCKKRRLSISSRLDTKKMKTMPSETQFPPLDSTKVFSAINEPLLITTTMLQSNNKKLDDSLILREDFDVQNNNVQMPILPPTPPTSADISPPPKASIEKEKKTKEKKIRNKPAKVKTQVTPPKRKQQQPRKRNSSMLKSHGMRDSPPDMPSPTGSDETTPVPAPKPTEIPSVKGKTPRGQPSVKAQKVAAAKLATHTEPPAKPCKSPAVSAPSSSSSTSKVTPSTSVNVLSCAPSTSSGVSHPDSCLKPVASTSKCKPSVNSNLNAELFLKSTSKYCSPVVGDDPILDYNLIAIAGPSNYKASSVAPAEPKTKVSTSAKSRKNKLVPSATDSASLPGNVSKENSEGESESSFVLPAKPVPGKKGGKRKSSPAVSLTGKKSKKSSAAALAAAREAEENAQSDLLKKTSLRKTLAPKWSNGWSWEGEPFQAKVFLRNDDTPVLRNCYPAMRHEEGDVVVTRDCVLLKSGTRKGDLPFVAKVAALWENPEDGEMMLSLLWYYRPEHTEKGRKPEDMPDEIFASKHKDSSSVACIEDKCYVFTFNEYCRYRANVRRLEEGAPPRPLVVPPLLPETSTTCRERIPSTRVSADLVFFCRKVYDFRQKRMLKNPG